MNWIAYVDENCRNGRHSNHPEWTVSGIWELVRSDGLRTAHPTESPFGGSGSKARCVDESMRLADLHIPLGTDMLEGMRTRDDPDYGPLWNLR